MSRKMSTRLSKGIAITFLTLNVLKTVDNHQEQLVIGLGYQF